MRKPLMFALAAAMLLSSASAFAASATTTTTTWTDEYGNIIREHSVTKRYKSVDDPKIEVHTGTALPSTVTLYDLPDTIRIQQPERYSYVIVNDRPVVVERSTRKIIRAW